MYVNYHIFTVCCNKQQFSKGYFYVICIIKGTEVNNCNSQKYKARHSLEFLTGILLKYHIQWLYIHKCQIEVHVSQKRMFVLQGCLCLKQDRKSLDAVEGKTHRTHLTDLPDWLTRLAYLTDLFDWLTRLTYSTDLGMPSKKKVHMEGKVPYLFYPLPPYKSRE